MATPAITGYSFPLSSQNNNPSWRSSPNCVLIILGRTMFSSMRREPPETGHRKSVNAETRIIAVLHPKYQIKQVFPTNHLHQTRTTQNDLHSITELSPCI